MNPPMHSSNQLTSFLHSHPLALMVRNPIVPSRTQRTCDVCRESIDGDFYSCNHCHFHVHQYCTCIPNSLRHVIDPKHKLSLLKLSSGRCSICKADCSSLWVYTCTACKVNIHIKCLRKPFGSKENTDRPSGSRGIHHYNHAPPPWLMTGNTSNQFGHHGPVQYFPHNSYPSYHTNHGPVHGYGQGHGHGHGPSSGFGSMMGGVMFTLVQNLAMGAFTDFIFGSIEF